MANYVCYYINCICYLTSNRLSKNRYNVDCKHTKIQFHLQIFLGVRQFSLVAVVLEPSEPNPNPNRGAIFLGSNCLDT